MTKRSPEYFREQMVFWYTATEIKYARQALALKTGNAPDSHPDKDVYKKCLDLYGAQIGRKYHPEITKVNNAFTTLGKLATRLTTTIDNRTKK